MKLGEVLRQVQGLEKRFVYYLEAQGDIRPKRLPKARIARRDYSETDVKRIARLWDYYRRGYALASARELLANEAHERAYVFVQVEQRLWAELLAALCESHRLLELSAVYGESADVVVKLEASRNEDVFQALHPAFDRGLLLGSPIIRRTHAVGVRGNRRGKGSAMLAYVLIKVPAKHIDDVLERLRAFEGIAEASAVYGETDIIAKLEVPNQDELDQLIIRRIQSLAEVEATRTFIAVGGMHWQRS